MRACAFFLLAGCFLDPQSVIDHAALKVDVYGMDGDHTRLRVTDTTSTTVEKNTPMHSDMTEVIFEPKSLADGPVQITAELFDAQNVLIGCATRTGLAGDMTDPVRVQFSESPSEDLYNCGSCGSVCVQDNAMASCMGGMCQYECNSGYVLRDGGCVLPVVPDAGPPPDAGPMPDAGMTDAGVDDGGTMMMDAGMVCMPSPENTDVTCSDGIDNNCDTRVDCADPGCQGISRTCMTSCNTTGRQTWDCMSHTWAACAGDPNDEHDIAACTDGIDNDCDGKTDCADSKCNNVQVACNTTLGACAGGVKLWICLTRLLNPVCISLNIIPEAPLFCGDGLDNNCNGKTDCADSTCSGKSCGHGNICCPDGSCQASCP